MPPQRQARHSSAPSVSSQLYHPTVYDRAHPVGSYWETTVTPFPSSPLRQTHRCHVAIIGAGITGLSAALHLAGAGVDVAVLDASYPAWGASGRNGGFCCVGATKLSDDALLQTFGKKETRRFYDEQRQAVDLVKQLAEIHDMDIQAQGEGELQVTHRRSRQRGLVTQQEFLQAIAHYPCRLMSREELADYGFCNAEAEAALYVGVGFGLNPMRYTTGLAQACVNLGAVLYGHSPVQRWEQAGGKHLLHTPEGMVEARQVIVATNGYTDEQLHPAFAGRLLPILSNIITTRPLTLEERSRQGWTTETPIYDTRNLLFYYRLLSDGRCLFGSRGGTRGTPTEGDRHRRWMQRRFRSLFPAWAHVEFTHAWSGLVCASATLTPQVGHLPDTNIFYSLAYHGNGVAAATWCGRAVARLVMGSDRLSDLCAVLRQPLKAFPLPGARLAALRAAYLTYTIQDALP